MKPIPYTIREIGGVPEFSAAPRFDREPPRDHRTADDVAPLVEGLQAAQERAKPLDPSKHPPAAVETWRRLQNEEARLNRAGALRNNVVGVAPDGDRTDPIGDWHWRPPMVMPGLHRDEEIILNGEVHFRQATPVHTAGAAFGSPREMARHLRVVGEAEASRRYFAQAGALWGEDVRGGTASETRAEIAARMGISKTRAKRRGKGRR